MKSLYFKIGLVVALCFALSFGVVLLYLTYLDDRPRPDMSGTWMANGMRWVVTELERAGPEHWGERLADMQPSFGFPLAVKTVAEVRAELEDEPLPTKPVSIGPHEGPRLYVPLADGTHYFVAGPIPHPPRSRGGTDMKVLIPVWLALSIAILSALAIATPITRRLRRLEEATRAVTEGDLQVRVPLDSADVVGQLGQSFNRMAARLEELFRQREQLLQAVSHEISTPLSRIRFHLEALERSDCKEKKKERLAALDRELTEVDRISKEMSSWVDADGRRPSLSSVAIAPVLQSIVERDRASPEHAKQIDLELADGLALFVRADGRQFQRAVENVLRNAVRYARERVVIAARSEGEHVRIEVRDDGPGIPFGDRTRIFEPFARLDESRSRKEGGMGLGLAITHRIVEAHGGEVWIEDAREGGASIVSRWPAGEPEPHEADV